MIPNTVEATKRVLQLGIRYLYCEAVFEYKFKTPIEACC